MTRIQIWSLAIGSQVHLAFGTPHGFQIGGCQKLQPHAVTTVRVVKNDASFSAEFVVSFLFHQFKHEPAESIFRVYINLSVVTCESVESLFVRNINLQLLDTKSDCQACRHQDTTRICGITSLSQNTNFSKTLGLKWQISHDLN